MSTRRPFLKIAIAGAPSGQCVRLAFSRRRPWTKSRVPSIGSFMANNPTQIFLPLIKSGVHLQADLYRAVFGATDAQMSLLAQGLPKRDYCS